MLLKNLNQPPTPIQSDEALRARINGRYLHSNGGSCREDLAAVLSRPAVSVFTHGDLAPRNIMVDAAGRITGVIDWENAG